MADWANEQKLSRLQVDIYDHVIAFIDTAVGESVLVAQEMAGPFPDSILVNADRINLRIGWKTKGEQVEGVTLRDVYHYVTAEHCTALRVGLTVHDSWFSSTPHTFELSPEPGFEEVFFFRSSTLDAKALLEGEGLWPDGTLVDAAWPVRDGQFAQIPMGSHRVCVLPVEDEQRATWWYWWCYLATEERWEKNR